MTIKTQNGKVITKDGKVSCECCEVECCMYPAAALVASLYSYEDLPDAIDVGGIEYTKFDPPESVGGFTRYYINANDEYLGILEGEGEDSLWTYEGGGGPCLINAFNGEGGEREDQFADTYTVNWQRTITVNRIGLCVWEGGDPCDQTKKWILQYNPVTCIWVLSGWYYQDNDCLKANTGNIFKKINGQFQNTPSGSYIEDNGFTTIIATVS
jgi:hypothetical protein